MEPVTEPKPINEEIANAVENIRQRAKAAGFREYNTNDSGWSDNSESEKLWNSSNVPRRHAIFSGTINGSQWSRKLELLKSLLGNGFLVSMNGGRGTGKTQMAVELIREATKAGGSAKYFTAMDFFMSIRDSYRKESRLSEMDALKIFIAPRLLVIDEVQERGETDWEDRLLIYLIDKRYRDMKDTLILSNLCESAFLQSLGPSIESRIRECGGMIECNWKSFRETPDIT